MEQKWRLKVTERKPKEADGALLLQAVLGLIKELTREERENDQAPTEGKESNR